MNLRKLVILFSLAIIILIVLSIYSYNWLSLSFLTPKTIRLTMLSAPAPPLLEADFSIPEVVRDAVANANPKVRMIAADTKAGARLVVSRQPTAAEWVLVPVAPFPTINDEILWSNILAFWQDGDNRVLPTLFCTQEVMKALEALLGKPNANASIKVVSPEKIVDEAWTVRPDSWAIVPFDQLTPRWKVLRLDGVSVLKKGLAKKDYPLRIHFSIEGEQADRFILPQFTNRNEEQMTILMMTGVTALVRATAAQMEKNGVLYPAQYIGSVLRSADITHISNEIPFVKNCPFPDANQKTLTFCSNPRYIELLRSVGTDVVELTGNHFEDYGPEATRETVAMYDKEGWYHYGGGIDLMDAQEPLMMIDHGNSISFMGCNSVGPVFAWASENYPGAAPCDFDYMHETLNQLKERVDIPVITWQYEEIYQYLPTSRQQEDFRAMIDASAKIVSGSQAHQPQAMEFYNDGFIHYGLGNLFFDQMDELGTRQECIDRHVIYNGRHISTELLTFMLENYAQPRPMTTEERQVLLQSLFSASGW